MKIFILGFGNMGQAIGRALAGKASLTVFDNYKKLKSAAGKIKAGWLEDFLNLASADFIIIAVKPKDIAPLADQISPFLNFDKTIVVSIAAGVTLRKLQVLLGHKKIVRVMPNLGLTVGQGIAVWKFSDATTKLEKAKAEKFLKMFTDGFAVESEDVIDRVTAISGNGPAYFFLLARSLEQAAGMLGFSEAQSRLLVEKTFSGAAELQKNQNYEELMRKVMSKKGTTEAAFKVFKKEKFDRIVRKAVDAAYRRAKEMGRG